MTVFPLLAIPAIFIFIAIHSALFPIPKKKPSAAVRYGEAFKELLDGIDCCTDKKQDQGSEGP